MARIAKNCQKLLRLSKIVRNCQDCWKWSKLSKIVKNCQKLSKIVKIVKIVKNCQKCQNSQKLSKLSKIVKSCQNCKKNCQNLGQVMFPHHSDQMSQRSQVSRIALCMAKVKVTDWVTESVSDKVTYWAVLDS